MAPVSRHVPPMLEHDVGYLLARSSAGALRAMNEALEAHGIRGRHFALLGLAATDEGVPQRWIGPVLGLDPSNVVTLVDDLERLGLVQRVPDPGDRRARRVTTTHEGRKVLAAARPLAADVREELLADLTEAEATELLRLLGLVVRRLVGDGTSAARTSWTRGGPRGPDGP